MTSIGLLGVGPQIDTCSVRGRQYYAAQFAKTKKSVCPETSQTAVVPCGRPSPRTVLYGETVEKIQVKDNRETRVVRFLHAIILGGVDVRTFPLAKRSALCTKFANTLNLLLYHLSPTRSARFRFVPSSCTRSLK
ncbi:uncharacterized protein LOC6041126 [Culex quinquefasciatus]|uniref:uncharacterized protein LOC6041126 n=1 Tax=Culex quinquefasciatus TaxID=7176 RepID=UPI0018E3D3E3|nr:uncharacterized protein LOC6041126 [Culex quinquefasciatus]